MCAFLRNKSPACFPNLFSNFYFNLVLKLCLLILNLKLGLTSKRTKEIKILLYKQPKMMCDLILFFLYES